MAYRGTSERITVRHRELAALSEFLISDRRGLLITGDVGMGKSRLLRSALEQTTADVLLIHGRSADEEPYSSLTRRELIGNGSRLVHLDQLLGEVAASSDAERDRGVDRLAVFTADAAKLPGTIVIALDDLEFIDEETRSLLFASLRSSCWRFLISSDGTESGPTSGMEVLALKGVDAEAVAEVLSGARETEVSSLVAHRLARISQGNPAVLMDIADHLSDETLAGRAPLPVPIAVGQACERLLGESLAGMDDDLLGTLATFAFHDQLPATVIDQVCDPAVVMELRQRRMIDSDGERWWLTPPVMALLAWSRLSPAGQADLHKRASVAYAEVDPVWSLMHEQWTGPIPTADLPAKLAELIDTWIPFGDADTALRLLDIVYPPDTSPAPADIERRRARLELAQGYIDLALESVRRGLQRDPDPAIAARLYLVGLGGAQFASQECHDLILDPALVADIPAELREYVVPLIVHQLLRLGQTDDAAELIAALEAADDHESLTLTQITAALRVDLALESATDEVEVTEARAALLELADIASNRPIGLVSVLPELIAIGELKLVRRLIGGVRRRFGSLPPALRALFDAFLARVEIADGRFVRSLQVMGITRAVRPTTKGVQFEGSLVRAKASAGTLAEDPLELLTRAQGWSDRVRASYEADIGHALLLAGRWTEAAYCLSTALDRSRLVEAGATSVLADLVEAHQLAGMPDQAERAAHKYRSGLLDKGAEQVAAILTRINALLATGTGAERVYQSAASMRGSKVRDLDRGRALICYGRWLLGKGRDEEAWVQLNEATYVMRSLGLEGWVDYIERIGRTGQTLHTPPSIEQLGQFQAKDRELVAHLVSGRTYDQIAAEMYLSRRTVATRLKAVYHRLGVANRAELVDFVSANRPDWI